MQAPETREEDQDRPPWQWSIIGAVAVFLAWLPLAALLNTLVARALRSAAPPDSADISAAATPLARAVIMGANAFCFAIAALGGGYLVGRFGGRAGVRQAMTSGLVAAVVAWLLAAAQSPEKSPLVWIPLVLLLAGLGGGAAYLGGRLGRRAARG